MTRSMESSLFSPINVGGVDLKHRVVMAPLTRSRSEQPGDIPGKLMLEYYSQRASDGALLISEATSISIAGRGWFGAPGLYSDQQTAGWKMLVDAVHTKGASMFSQLWHVGRSSHESMTNGAMPVAPSVVPEYWLDSTPRILRPMAGSNPRRIVPLTLPKFQNLSRIIAELLSAQKQLASTASNCMPPTVICSMNFFKMAVTSEPTPTAAR